MFLDIQLEDVTPILPEKAPAARVKILIQDVTNRAINLVPELAEDMTQSQHDQAVSIIRKAIQRYNESLKAQGTTTKSVKAGPHDISETFDAQVRQRPMFYEDEVDALKRIFRDRQRLRGKATSVDLTATTPAPKGEWLWI